MITFRSPVFCVSLLFWQLSQPSPARQAKAAGVEAARVGDYSRAALEFGRACTLDPKLPDACFYEGRSLYYGNRFEDAIAPLRRSLQMGESAARAHSTIAQCYEALGKPGLAQSEHRNAIADDRTGQYKVRFAVFLFRQGRVDEAIAPLTEALQQDENNFEANLQMGRVLFEQDKFPSALSYLDKALRMHANSTEAHLLAAKVCQQLGRTAEAERHLKAVQIPEP